MMEIKTTTKRIISISNPGADITGSLYNHIFDDNSLYLPATIKNLNEAICGIRGLVFSGASVSMPYKQDVMKLLDAIDADAQIIGAVNTLYFSSEGELRGTNTDWTGALLPVLRHFSQTSLHGKTALVIGAGGAARAVIYGLKKYDANVEVFNRTAENARTISNDFGIPAVSFLDSPKKYDIVINATSYEFNAEILRGLLIPENIVASASLIMDVVFEPCDTSLILAAKKHKIPYIQGSKMLVTQAIKQAEYWGIDVNSDIDVLIKKIF